MSDVLDWIRENDTLLWLLAAASVATLIASMIVVPLIVVRMPSDYFSHKKRHRTPWADHHPVVRGALVVGKNVLGLVFIVVGSTLLVLPGQGILTAFVGLMLLDLPGKYRLERWLVARGPILRSLNWLRRRAQREPLTLEPEGNDV